MCEKLTLTRYLKGRGEVKALTHIEAQAFGVPYPLQPGWPAKYGPQEITAAMIEDLKAKIATAKESTASKARRGLDGIVGTELTNEVSAAPIIPTEKPATVSNRSAKCPGFALRQARRYRSRNSAPWT